MTRYTVLNYAADVRELGRGVTVPRADGGEVRTVPVLLGVDVMGHPYEVLDVEVLAEADGRVTRCAVHLGPAAVDTTRGNRSAVHAQRLARADLADEQARVRAFWRPDLYATPHEPSEAERAARIDAMRAVEAAKAANARGAA